MKQRIRYLKWLLNRCLQRIDSVNKQIEKFPNYGSYTRTLDSRKFTHPEEFTTFSRLYDSREFWICCRTKVLEDINQYID